MLAAAEPRPLVFCFSKLLAHCLLHENSSLLLAQNKQQTFMVMARAKHTSAARRAGMGYSLRVYTVPDVPASGPPPIDYVLYK